MCEYNVDIITFRLPAAVSVEFNLRKKRKEGRKNIGPMKGGGDEQMNTYPPAMVLTQPGSTVLR